MRLFKKGLLRLRVLPQSRISLSIRSRYIIIVILSALIIGIQSIAIEGALNTADLNIFLVSAIPTLVGGLILVSITYRSTSRLVHQLHRRGWTSLILLCIFIVFGVLLWFDAVGRIGAGKEALIGGGSSEVLFVVLLSAIFLRERLNRWEILGSVMIVFGVALVLLNTESLTFGIGLGEIEAMVSSFMLAISVVMVVNLLKIHALTPLSGLELLISGALILLLGVALDLIEWPASADGWLILIGLALFPALGLVTYNAGLPKIGASLTSVLFALTGILTVGLQLLILGLLPNSNLILPQNIFLALAGGLTAFIGVYLIYLNPTARRSRETISQPVGPFAGSGGKTQ